MTTSFGRADPVPQCEEAGKARLEHGLVTLFARRDTGLRDVFAPGLDAWTRRLQRHRLGLCELRVLVGTKDAM